MMEQGVRASDIMDRLFGHVNNDFIGMIIRTPLAFIKGMINQSVYWDQYYKKRHVSIQIYYWRSFCETCEHYNSLIKYKWNID